MPQSRTVSWRSSARAGERAPDGLGRHRRRPHALQLRRRARAGRGPSARRGPRAEGRRGRARCRPAPGPSRRTGPAPASGRRPPSPRGRPASRAAPSAVRRSPRSRCSSAGSTADGRPWNWPTTSAVRSSAVGPEPAGGDHQGHAGAGQEVQRPPHVLRPVAHQDDVPDVDARGAAAARPARARCGRSPAR